MQENTVCAANCTVQEKRGGQKIMLIRNATLQMSATERACMDVRVMNGCVWEMGAALVKGLYEAEIDLCGDVLMPGRMQMTDRMTDRMLMPDRTPMPEPQIQRRRLPGPSWEFHVSSNLKL